MLNDLESEEQAPESKRFRKYFREEHDEEVLGGSVAATN